MTKILIVFQKDKTRRDTKDKTQKERVTSL